MHIITIAPSIENENLLITAVSMVSFRCEKLRYALWFASSEPQERTDVFWKDIKVYSGNITNAIDILHLFIAYCQQTITTVEKRYKAELERQKQVCQDNERVYELKM